MRVFTALVAIASFAILGAANPVTLPLKDGVPNPSNTSLANIEKTAKGTTPNSALPPEIDDVTTTSFQLIAFNELFESSFFSELLSNITNGVPGYEIPTPSYVDNLKTILAQEEIHALTANTILKHFNKTQIQDCAYQFPVDNLDSAIQLAQKFTDLVIGTLNDVQTNAAMGLGSKGAGFVNALAPVIGNEGQQDGWYRAVQRKTPSAQPFLTGATRAFAWNALQQFVVPNKCPSRTVVDLPIFGGLTLLTQLVDDGQIQFEAAPTANATLNPSTQSMVYLNGANVPLVVPFKVTGNCTVTANFPLAKEELYGLTIAAIVKGQGPFDSADAVADATVFGPGLIEVD